MNINTRNLLYGVAVLLLLAGLGSASLTAHAVNCAKNPTHPKCDDPPSPPPSGEILLTATFNCPVSALNVLNRACGSPKARFQADFVAEPYVHGDDNVRNRVNTSGYFVLTMHEKQNKVGTRKVYWDLPSSVTLRDGTSLSGEQGLASNQKTVIQVGKFTGSFDMRALAPGEKAKNIDMILDLMVFNGKRVNDTVFVRYSPPGTGQCPAGDIVDGGVTVERRDTGEGEPRQWKITPDGAFACMYTYTHYPGNFNFGDWELTVDELP